MIISEATELSVMTVLLAFYPVRFVPLRPTCPPPSLVPPPQPTQPRRTHNRLPVPCRLPARSPTCIAEQKWEGTVIRSLSEARIRINQNIGIDDFNFIQNIYDFILSIIYINAHTEYNENLYDYRINISYDDDENR